MRRDDSGDTIHWDEVSPKKWSPPRRNAVEIDDRFTQNAGFNGISVEVPIIFGLPNHELSPAMPKEPGR